MNFQDIVNMNNQQFKALDSITEFMNQVIIAKEYGEEIYNQIFQRSYVGDLSSIQSDIISAYKVFQKKIIAIEAYDLALAIYNVKKIYNNKTLNELLDGIEKGYKEVSRIKNLEEPKDIVDEYNNCIRSLNTIILNYNTIIELFNYTKTLNIQISQGICDIPLQIRFLNENNTVSNLIEDVKSIKSIYDDINKLIGDGSELKYCRVESGTLEVSLLGCGTVLLAIKPILELSYKVYSEQFSPKAKLQISTSTIKVRGEYLKLLKEINESEEVKHFNGVETDEVVAILANLDADVKNLYKNNPFIRVDNQDLGCEELRDKNIPIELLKYGDEDIKSLLESDPSECK